MSADEENLRDEIRDALKKTFRPEFLNRVDEIIIFHNLTEEHMLEIVDLQMHEVSERLAEQGVAISLSAAAREWLADKGYDPQFGARPLRRALQRYIENPLSIQLLSGELSAGNVIADVVENAIAFRSVEGTREPEGAAEPEAEPVPATDDTPDRVPADETVPEAGD
jgi:ATP-dependent Clp protease ATP-binding subunit ClpA